MAEYKIDENGCKGLSEAMLVQLREIAGVISEIQNQEGTLRAALGDDYDAIAKKIRVMSGELDGAYKELDTIIKDMKEYITRVGQARVALD